MAESNPWRDKYRRTLAQQEKLEQTLAAQQAILQRAVTNLCAAAEGNDSLLDERLQAILACVKHNDVAGFDRMLKSLPRITEEVDERQQKHWKELAKTLSTIANQIQKQSPSSEIKPAVKHFQKQLPKDFPIPATLKRLLIQISDIQKQALELSPRTASTGIFGKLFKDNKSEGEGEGNTQESAKQEQGEQSSWEEFKDDPEQIGEAKPLEGEIIGYQRERHIPEALLQAHYEQEEKSPKVPDRVAVILSELLDHFKTVPSAEEKANKARQRIENGIRWFELAPTLEDIRDFVMQSYLGADAEYQQYLENIYGELSEILSALGVSIETEQQVRNAADSLHDSVSEGMDNISHAINEHNNIDTLKQAVENHVQQLQSTLSGYKQQTSKVSESETLANQLQALANKVQEMEKNEEEAKQLLEEEKQRALTDSLTGLPNREAWGQRSHQEMLRWQRYKHPLSMAVIDIDFFKKINDNYGHQTGDKVLKIVSNAVAKKLRNVDFIARFGGEEFVVLLPETASENALLMLNRIREGIANAPFRYKNQKINITVSIGVSEYSDGDTSETVFERADQALYQAKETGRNKCCILD